MEEKTLQELRKFEDTRKEGMEKSLKNKENKKNLGFNHSVFHFILIANLFINTSTFPYNYNNYLIFI